MCRLSGRRGSQWIAAPASVNTPLRSGAIAFARAAAPPANIRRIRRRHEQSGFGTAFLRSAVDDWRLQAPCALKHVHDAEGGLLRESHAI
jgi:hypothetical protein